MLKSSMSPSPAQKVTATEDIQKRANQVFTGGISNGEYGLLPEEIIAIDHGIGAKIWDTSGTEFIDFSMAWGSCLIGHANSEVTNAVLKQVPQGSNFAFLNPNALCLGEKIKNCCPAVERLRFCASGTEATMYCERIARGYTGRNKIMKFEGAYHGASDTGVTSLFPKKLYEFPKPESTGSKILDIENKLLVSEYNNLAITKELVEKNANDLAAVIIEPLQRCTPPESGFLEGVRKICTNCKVLLIFDEVVTGFRLAYGGAQEYYGVIPDLVAYGKALGGGYPIGAFGGKAKILDIINEHRIGTDDYVWMASTLGGNPISTAAAIATLNVLKRPGTYGKLHERGKYLRTKMREVIKKYPVNAQIIGDGPLAQIVFTDKPIKNYRTANTADKTIGRNFMLGLFKNNIFLNPMGTKLYLSIAHDKAILDEFLNRFEDVFKSLLNK